MKVSIFLKYPQHVLITFILQSQIINHNIYINSYPHDLQWVSYRYLDKRKSPINGLFTPFMKLCLLFKLDKSLLCSKLFLFKLHPKTADNPLHLHNLFWLTDFLLPKYCQDYLIQYSFSILLVYLCKRLFLLVSHT